jgi:hypothetical protein
MYGFVRLAAACACLLLFASRVEAQESRDEPWSVTVFAGPSTTKFFGAVFQGLNMHPTAMLIGVALDRKVIDLGNGVSLGIDAQGGDTEFGDHTDEYGAGLNIRIDGPFGFRHSTLTIFDGPSWLTNTPRISIGYHEKVFPFPSSDRFDNYIGFEEAIALSRSGKWDGVIRLIHRSGMWNIYSPYDDGMAIGAGLRYRF